MAKLCIQAAAVLVLSRMLGPEDFGLIAMVAVVMKLGELLRDFGLPTAALQAPTLSHQQASNMFWINSCLGMIAAIAAVASTPLLILVYSEPRLAAIVPAMAATLAFNGMQAQLQVQLARSMRFRALAVTDVISQAVGLVIAVVAAAAGWHYWALVAQVAVAAVALLVSRLLVVHWFPKRPRRGHGTMAMVRAGGSFGVAQLLGFASTNADTVSIGAVWGPMTLGFYNRAFQLYSLPLGGVLSPLSNVVVPAVNRARVAGHSTYELLLRIQFAIGLAGVWAFSVSASTAPALIPIILGDSWSPAISIFQILAIGGLFQTLSYVNYWVFIVEQQQRQLVFANLVTKSLSVLLVVAGAFINVEAVALGFSLGLISSWLINLVWLSKCARQPSMTFFRNGSLLLLAGAAGYAGGSAAVAVCAVFSDPLQTVIGAAAATVAFGTLLTITPYGRKNARAAIRTLPRPARFK